MTTTGRMRAWDQRVPRVTSVHPEHDEPDLRVQLAASDLGELLESPRWHAVRQRISLVDIPTGRLFEIAPNSGTVVEYSTGLAPLGAALPMGNGYLLVGSDCVWHWDPARPVGQMTRWGDIPSSPDIMSNDAILHDGAVWVGRMDSSETAGRGSVWRITPSSSTLVVADLTLPNGMVLAPDGKSMLLAESKHRCIYRVPLDAKGLGARQLEVFLDLPDWTPDGLAWDALGRLWVARWSEGRVTCVSEPSGVEDVVLSTPQVTAVAFDHTGKMYITTAREGFTEVERRSDPDAGSVFTFGSPQPEAIDHGKRGK